ncbi:hypothetical protein TEA_001424 [Camellia sinensis var. sinensis]|uniref:ABC transmembrane type-1 domain-containing protein n=1 Tax=Camellia sinensis var. sinensis TaxID=542762 RepID=A0A4S4D4J0_CAMSN|nr:hypothetical protein TEA_001424 [Camellia sinensis var. sinensis]
MEVQNKQHPSHDEEQVVVIMVPFPCQSYLNQLLELSCLISSYNIPVHYACWGTHIHQVKQRFNGTRNNIDDVNANIIHFHEFPTPPNLSPSPLKSSFHLRQPVASLLQKISRTTRRVIIIHDVVMAYKRQEVPEGLPSMQDSGVTAPELVNLSSLHSDFRSGSIINSCRSIEGPYIDLLEKEHIAADQKQWAIGPLNLYDSINSKGQHKCLEWLDKQAPNSVLYVSFGSTTSMTDEQIKELAIGLEQSEQKFIWVFRHADEGSIFSEDVKRGELPEGYAERMKEVGMVVRDWAPQLQILGHPSTGGFMSHCGWNSCTESISMGVPIATWPMNFDQPINAFLVTNILKVSIPVNQWAQQKELVSSSTVAKAIKTLMASKEGEEMRKKAEELGGATRLSVKEGGDLDSFIAHIKASGSSQDETIQEEREELMVSPTGGIPTSKTAHFLKPTVDSIRVVPSLSLSSKPTISDFKKTQFLDRRYPAEKWKTWVDRLLPLHHHTWKKAEMLFVHYIHKDLGLDYVLMAIGTVGAIVHGSSLPPFLRFFADLVNSFGSNANNIDKMTHEYAFYFLLGLQYGHLHGQISGWIWTGERQSTKMRIKYLEAALNQDIPFFDTEVRTSDVIFAINIDAVMVQDAISEKLGNFLHYMATFVSGFVVGFTAVWQLALVTLAVVPLIAVIGGVHTTTLAKLSSKSQEALSEAGNIAEQVKED